MSAVEMTDTNALRRLAQAATPGPWHATKSVETNSWAVWSDTTRLMELRPTKTVDMYRVSNTAAFIAAANPAAISELLDRLEAAEKERDFAKVEIARLHDDIHELIDERDALRAKIEAMERQEPVAEIGQQYTLLFVGGGSITGIVERHGIKVGDKLYALPGAKGEEK